MRIRISILLLLVSSYSLAQTSFLKEAVAKLDRALVAKDTVTLKQLLHKSATYGHSTAWVETKEELIKDLVSGKLTYQSIKSDSLAWKVEANWASVRSNKKTEVVVNGNRMEMHIHVLEVWLKTNKGWQMIARQSTRL